MRRYSVRRSERTTLDLDLIERHLIENDQGFGYAADEATARAFARGDGASAYIRTFSTSPYRGTLLPAIRDGLRSVTHQDFIFYFDVDEALSRVTILAVFFGGADHRSQIIARLK